MSTDHTHINPFSTNNKIVCNDCITADDRGKNECFCKCHKDTKLICPACERFHRE